MEELQATQEEMARKERDYISRIQDLERNQSRPGEAEELQRIKGELTQKEHHYAQQLRDLESKLAQKPAKTGDWALAEEVEKTLRFQLEALRIAQEEFPGK